MSDIVAVLVVPAEGDPGRLFGPVALAGRPPLVTNARSEWTPYYGLIPPKQYRAAGVALPLWWDGALVPEGWDRARRVGIAAWNNEPNPDLDTVHICAVSLRERGWGARVVRLARVDGRLVEVAGG